MCIDIPFSKHDMTFETPLVYVALSVGPAYNNYCFCLKTKLLRATELQREDQMK